MKLLWACVLLSALASSASAQEFTCPSEGLHPDPTNCQAFYQCANGRPPFRNVCPSTTLFHEVSLNCDFDYNVDCGDRPNPIPTTSTVSTESTPSTSSTPVDPTATTTPTTTTSTTTTTQGQTTTTAEHITRYPNKVMAFYILLADDTEEGFESDADNWTPMLYEYQQQSANVLFFTFIHPETMAVPPAFEKLAKTRGTGAEGAVPSDTVILFAIGGYQYSIDVNPWPWLTSKAAAEQMAEEVATWPERYGCDGIDLDIEEGAGSRPEAGPYMIDFIRKLRELRPEMIIGQPTYGYPQIQAEIDVINASWNPGASSNNLADSIGLMVYEGALALDYVKNYAEGSSQWEGFPIHVDVPYQAIMLGCKGISSADSINTLATESVRQNLLGIMVWFASVRNGFQYEVSWDASIDEPSQQAYIAARQLFDQHNNLV